jgi:hypothetical protein
MEYDYNTMAVRTEFAAYCRLHGKLNAYQILPGARLNGKAVQLPRSQARPLKKVHSNCTTSIKTIEFVDFG